MLFRKTNIKNDWFFVSMLLLVSLSIACFCCYCIFEAVNTKRWDRTTYQIISMASLLSVYSITHDGFPDGSTFREVHKTLMKDDHYQEMCSTTPTLRKTQDAWGNEIIFIRVNTESAIVRSPGRNGVDENGEGDDIQYEARNWSSESEK